MRNSTVDDNAPFRVMYRVFVIVMKQVMTVPRALVRNGRTAFRFSRVT